MILIAGTSNVVLIDALRVHTLVVTPSPFEAWHGIVIGFRP